MAVITQVPEKNLWEEICKEFAARAPPFKEDDSVSIHTEYVNYNASKHNPVFYGKMYQKIQNTDEDPYADLDPSKIHPACAGFAFTDKPPDSPKPPPSPPPHKDKCTPTEYLEYYVFPILLPALEEMLRQAKKEKCLERKRTKFNALDYLTEYLYRHNPKYEKRENIQLEEIPFVKAWLKDHPRPPLPLSLIWTEEEACLIIQSFWRGYLVRRQPDIQELRQWQREWREENRGIQSRVSDFWEKKMPDWDKPSPNASEDKLDSADKKIDVKSPTP